jgi:hypothetical protein
VNNVPYTLTRISTIVRTVANGTTITKTFTVRTARDSEGRTYSETQQTLHIRADGQPVDLDNYFVSDPIARTNIKWDKCTKIVYVTHMPDSDTAQHRSHPMQVPDVDAARQPQVVRSTQQATREDLGVRTIAGIEASGTRTTGIIRKGDWGNDQPLTIVTENWMSLVFGRATVVAQSVRSQPTVVQEVPTPPTQWSSPDGVNQPSRLRPLNRAIRLTAAHGVGVPMAGASKPSI